MMRKSNVATLLILFKKREVNNPKHAPGSFLYPVIFLRQLQAQIAQALAHLRSFIGSDQQQVAFLRIESLSDFAQLLFIKEFINGRFHRAVFVELNVYQSAQTAVRRLYKLSQLIGLLARISSTALCIQ